MILRLLKKSVRSELKDFYNYLTAQDGVFNWVSTSAFCKARQKISYELFKDLSRFVSDYFYTLGTVKRWHGYRILAGDGSAYNLPASKELVAKFGHHHTNAIGTQIPQVRVSILCDAFNFMTLDAQIGSFTESEQDLFEKHLDVITSGDLLTLDSNYGHFRILKLLNIKKIDYCIKMSKSSVFVKQFLESGEKDAVLEWLPSATTRANCQEHGLDATTLKVRLVRVISPNQEVSVLATSLLDTKEYNYESIKELYHKRWVAEEEYKKIMQRLEVELFSSIKVNGVLQDFYANVFLMNVVWFLAAPVNEQVYQLSITHKHRKQINWTSALFSVRSQLVQLFYRQTEQVCVILDSLWKAFEVDVESIRPERIFPRDKRKKGSRKKASIAYKPAF